MFDGKNKIVIFEDINYILYPVLFFFIKKDYSVYVFDFKLDLKKYGWIKKLINSGVLHRIYIKPATEEHGRAIDNVSRLIDVFRITGIINVIEKYYGIRNVSLVFKKTLLRYLFRYIYIDSFLAKLEKERDNQELVFIPSDYLVYKYWFKKAKIQSEYEYKYNVKRIFLLVILTIKDLIIRIFYYIPGMLFYLLYISAVSVKNTLFSKNYLRNIKCTNVFAIQHEYQLKYKGVRAYDFLVSDNTENNNFIFISDIPRVENRINSKVLNVSNVRNILFTKNMFLNLVKVFPISIYLFPLLYKPTGILHAYVVLLVTYLKWDHIISSIKFDNFIYTNNEGPKQIVINEIVRKYKSKSWSYNAFMAGGYLRSKSALFNNERHILWAFLNYDNFIAMNKAIVRYYKLHQQDVRNYHVCGSLSGQLIKEVSGTEKNYFIKKYFGDSRLKSEYKIIAAFDTTFIDELGAHTSYRDCVDFYRDILNLINDNDNYLCVVKPSKDEGFYTNPEQQWSSPSNSHKLVSMWDKVKSHPRVNWAGDTGDSAEIMSNCDLVVTHCFSSTSGEALSVGKKAIWYESGEGHRDMYLDKIKGLVAHGYSELKESVEYFLNMSEEEYKNYLDKNIKGPVDEYLDGQGIKRFKQLLGMEDIK